MGTLIRVAAGGSSFAHLSHDGGFLTLCGRVAIVRHRPFTGRHDCRRCGEEARRRRLTIQ